MKAPKTDRQKYSDALWRQGQPARDAERARMLATQTPVPRSITLALDYRELYGPEVDEALGVAEPMVDWWESGAVIPTAENMLALAELTDFPVEFFYREHPKVGPMWLCGPRCQFVAGEA